MRIFKIIAPVPFEESTYFVWREDERKHGPYGNFTNVSLDGFKKDYPL